MLNWQTAAWAALIGGCGSLAYFSALYFGFVQGDDILNNLWPKNKSARLFFNILRIIWFSLIGAAVAFIFQLPQGSNLAPIQGFIMGTTWPTIVAQILTSRQSQTPDSIKDQIAKLAG